MSPTGDNGEIFVGSSSAEKDETPEERGIRLAKERVRRFGEDIKPKTAAELQKLHGVKPIEPPPVEPQPKVEAPAPIALPPIKPALPVN